MTEQHQQVDIIAGHCRELFKALKAAHPNEPATVEAGIGMALSDLLTENHSDPRRSMMFAASLFRAMFASLKHGLDADSWLRIEDAEKSRIFAAMLTGGFPIPVATKVSDHAVEAAEYAVNWLEYFGNFASHDNPHVVMNAKLMGAQLIHDKLCAFLSVMRASGMTVPVMAGHD